MIESQDKPLPSLAAKVRDILRQHPRPAYRNELLEPPIITRKMIIWFSRREQRE
jgi:hypothetical protein